MINKEDYLEAKKIVEQYEKEHEDDVVLWKCNRKLRMEGTKEIVFTGKKLYKQVNADPVVLIDDDDMRHTLGEWQKWFTKQS